MDREDLYAWASAAGVAGLLYQAAGAAAGDDPAVAGWWKQWRALTVEDVVTYRPSRTGKRGVPEQVQAGVIRVLRARAGAVVAGLAREAARGRVRAVRPRDPVLAEAWETLIGLRAGCRGQGPPTLDEDALQPVLQVDPPAVVYEVAGTRVTIPLDGLDVDPGADPSRVLAGVDRTLDLLTDPRHAHNAARIRAILEIPPWERGLARIASGLLPPEPGVELGWRVEAGPLKVRAVSCTPRGEPGEGFVTRLVGPGDVQSALKLDPRDERALVLTEGQGSLGLVLALDALVGHPRVFFGRGGQPVPVRRGRFVLRIEAGERGLGLVATVDGRPADVLGAATASFEDGIVPLFGADGITLVRVRPVTLDLLREWSTVGAVPEDGREDLLALVPAIATLAPLELDPTLRGRRVATETRPLARVSADHTAVTVSIWVRPLPEVVPSRPGEGSSEAYAVRSGQWVHARRDHETEVRAARELAARLGLAEADAGTRLEWTVPIGDRALELVERLIAAEAGSAQVEWTGPIPRLGKPIEAEDVEVTVRPGNDWFSVEAEATLAGETVDLVRAVRGEARFVRLASGTWRRIADAVARPLALVARDDANPLLAPALDALALAGARVDAPAAWHEVARRAREAVTLQVPPDPRLRATLRPYQEVGLQWLAALAHWAPGAVLADDMGLGKTLQSIALLLHRASQGAALVVAPTSVVHGWLREAARFAPDLRMVAYQGASRADRLEGVGPGDVVVTSWGLLARDADVLADVGFATVVLDEAQAIKNPDTQRAQAARGLGGGFTLALSGTPIENALIELWSLFQAVVPHLLGTRTWFEHVLAGPVEDGSAEARERLRALVHPFVLRRTKEEVLDDLPPKVHSTVYVELSDPERALYEVARRDAMERIRQADGNARRMAILTELTRLRQLACHPRLIDASSSVPSSKLRAVRRIVSDLRASGHRALIFSQFVRHLELVRAALEADGVEVRQLDGSLPMARRMEEVDAFQAGRGDVFLISLKAGGVGLNLTEASYVLHLDPWWNPAAEDQATDRAHRIGQRNSVTVYRLVATETVEERIVALHERKRELAAAILDGADQAERVDIEVLMALLADR